jgi:hypothetical protein
MKDRPSASAWAGLEPLEDRLLLAVLPTVTMAATTKTAVEQSLAAGVFTVTRSAASANPLTVNLYITGTAANGVQYQKISNKVTIPANQTTATVTITPLDDKKALGDTTVVLDILAGNGYTVGNPEADQVTIQDKAPKVSIAAANATVTEAAGDHHTTQFTVTLSAAPAADTDVLLSVSGDARSGRQFQALPKKVTIPAGQTTTSFTLTPLDDNAALGDQTLTVSLLGNPKKFSVDTSKPSATVTIQDSEPIVSVAASTPNASETSLSAGVFTFSRTGGTASALTVKFSVSGTAAPGKQYVALPKTVTIGAGQASTTLSVTPLDDGHKTGNRTVIVKLNNVPKIYSVDTYDDSAAVTIQDKEPIVSIIASTASAVESSLTAGVFTISRTGDKTQDLTVKLTIGGTATSGTMYVPISKTVTIAAGTSSTTVNVTPLDDHKVTGNKTVTATIIPDALYTLDLTKVKATVTIVDKATA